MADTAVTVTLRLTAKDGPGFQDYLRTILPDTRAADGCRASATYVSPDDPAEFIFIQQWDSLTQQQAYMQWREETGVLATFINHLAKPPVVEVWCPDDSI